MATLTLRSVSKRFGATPAAREVSLAAGEGELLVLVGPSGSGKSTILRMVAGLEDPDEGSIHIGDRDVTAAAPSSRDVAMVFQSYALFPHMTVFDNLAFGLAARRAPKETVGERVGGAAARLGLGALLDRYPRQLSGGERQRVALGRAIVRDPAVFLMDEPLSNLDAQLRVETRAEIVRVQRALRTTTLYVTHDQTEALSIGDRIGVLRDGALLQIGTPREIYDAPASLFVARFMGTPPMNAVSAQAAGGAVTWAGARYDAPGTTDGPVTLGVRPEHVHVAGSRWSEGGARGAEIGAVVEAAESVGDQVLLQLRAGDDLVWARAEPSFHLRPGDETRIWLDAARLHLFDAATGAALGR